VADGAAGGGFFTASAWRSPEWRRQVPIAGGGDARFAETPLVPRARQFQDLLLPSAVVKAPCLWASAKGSLPLSLCTLNVNGVKAKCGGRAGTPMHAAFCRLACAFDVLLLQEAHEYRDALRELLPRSAVFVCPNVDHTLGMAAVLGREGAGWAARVIARDFVFAAQAGGGGGGGGGAPPPWPRARALTLELKGGAIHVAVLSVHRPYARSSASVAKKDSVQGWMAAFEKHLGRLCELHERVVVCGDFNMNAAEEGERIARGDPRVQGGIFAQLARRGFVDALAGTSEAQWPTHFPASSRFAFDRLDFIFVSPQLAGCIVPGSGAVLSEGAPAGDHVPVVVTLAL
jgi:exonuclease III